VTPTLVAAALVVLIAIAGDAALRWAGRRGWIYYRNHPAPPGAGRSGMLEVMGIYQPGHLHLAEYLDDQHTTVDEVADDEPLLPWRSVVAMPDGSELHVPGGGEVDDGVDRAEDDADDRHPETGLAIGPEVPEPDAADRDGR